MLSVVLLGAVAALRAPGRGRPAGSLPKKPLRGGRDTAELFVANLPDDSDRNEFLNFARSAFPAVRRVTVPRDRSTGAARGFVRDPCPIFSFQWSLAALRRPPHTSPRDRIRTLSLAGVRRGAARRRARGGESFRRRAAGLEAAQGAAGRQARRRGARPIRPVVLRREPAPRGVRDRPKGAWPSSSPRRSRTSAGASPRRT